MDYLKHFETIVKEQIERVEKMKDQKDFIDYAKLDKLIIGTVGGDGIGPAITAQAARILEYLLKDDIAAGKVEIRVIEDLTIENQKVTFQEDGITVASLEDEDGNEI